MALAPSDLREPKGSVALSLFPGDDVTALDARLQAYLDDATARTTSAGIAGALVDEAIRAWADYRAFDAVVIRLSSTPASVTIQDQGARSMTNDQLRLLAAKRDAALGRWNALVPASAEEGPDASVGRGPFGTSGSTRVLFGW